MLKPIAFGIALTIATVGIHAVGTTWWIRRLQRLSETQPARENTGPNQFLVLKILSSTAFVLLTLHILEVAVWAIAYLAIPNLETLNSLEEATYFSTVTFTTLGYGDIVIDGPWRMFAAIQAMAGHLIFGWSTALLFAVVQRIWSENHESQLDS